MQQHSVIPTPVDLYFEEIRPSTEAFFKDELTGYWNRGRRDVAELTLRYAFSNKVQAFCVAFDIRNVSGANAALNWSGVCERIFKPFTGFFRQALEGGLAQRAQIFLFRQGGDEFSAILAGLPGRAFAQDDVAAVLRRFVEEVDCYAKAQGLDDIPNPKGRDYRGVGVTCAFGSLSAAPDVGRALEIVDEQVERKKMARR